MVIDSSIVFSDSLVLHNEDLVCLSINNLYLSCNPALSDSSANNVYLNPKADDGDTNQGDRTNRSKSHFRCYSSLNHLDLVCFEVSEHIKM